MIHPVPHPKPRKRKKKVARPLARSRIKNKGQRRFPGRENPRALELIRTLPCAPCRHMGVDQETPTEVEHWVTKARGGYDLSDCFPTCRYHAELRHHLGDQEFSKGFGHRPDRWCAETCRWLCHQPGVLESGEP